MEEAEMRRISRRFDDAGKATVAPTERDRALDAAELDRVAAAGGPNSGGLGSGGGSGGGSN
jgi:hypothetical protein